MKHVRVAVAAIALALLTVLAGATPAAAHATLKDTTPGAGEVISAPSKTVHLRFDEPVKTVGQGVRVFGPDGERVDAGRSTVRGGEVQVNVSGTARGTYTVAWRVVSDDGHNLSGSFVFHLGKQTGAVDVTERVGLTTSGGGGLGRFLAFAAAIFILGAASLASYSREDAVRARLRMWVLGAAVVGLVAVALVLVAQAARATGQSLTGGFASTWDLARNTRTGQFSLVRLAVFGLAALAALPRRQWKSLSPFAGFYGAAAMVAVSLSGHPWSSADRPIAVVSDIAHQGFVGVWVGGVLALLVGLRVAADRVGLVYRFSKVAFASAIGVLVTGSVSAFLNVRSLDVVLSTGYGQLVVAKVVGFAALCALGWMNRRRYLPLLAKTVEPLARSLRLEVAVAAIVLAITAGLVNQPPAANAINRAFETTVVSGDASLLVSSHARSIGPQRHPHVFLRRSRRRFI